MARRKSLSDLSQVNAKEEVFTPTTLDQIWGDDGYYKYGTMDEEEYKNKLNEMNKTDLWNHASKIGLMPIDNTSLLRKTLFAEFKKHVNSYKKINSPQLQPQDISKEAMKILSEGR